MSMEFQEKKGFDLVTLVLPDHTKEEALSVAVEAGACNIIQFGARGSVLSESESLLSKMFPPPSPKRRRILVNSL